MSIPVGHALGRALAVSGEVAPPPRLAWGGDSGLAVDYQLPDEPAGVGSPGPVPGALPEEGGPTVVGPIGAWEIDAIEWYDDLPFELPPMGAESTQPDDSLATAMPIVTTGPVALVGTLSPADQVDYYKIDGKEVVYQLAFGNAQASARGGQRIILLDRHGRSLHSLVMPSGKGVLALDLRQIQAPGEPLYIGIAREGDGGAAAGSEGAAAETYWMFVRTPARESGGDGSSWYDFAAEFAGQDSGRVGEASESSSDTETETVEVTVAAEELVTVPNAVGLPTGPLPRLAAGFNRGLLAPSFDVGWVSPAEGLALDLPAQALEGDSLAAESGVDPGPLVAVRGARSPLLAAAYLSPPSPPSIPSEVDAGGGGASEVAADPVDVEAEVEAKPSRRLPAGLGLATVLAVSLLLPDFMAIRPVATLRRRLGLGTGGGVGPRS